MRAVLVSTYVDPYRIYKERKTVTSSIINSKARILQVRVPCVSIRFQKMLQDEYTTFQTYYFCCKSELITSTIQIYEAILRGFNKMFSRIENLRNGSGWSIKEIHYLDLHFSSYRDNLGIRLNVTKMKFLKNKKALLNMHCKDDLCLLQFTAVKIFPKKTM
ncbi:hypothetical protein X975_04631, partial [Stegodyphus mimosarum]